MGDDIENGATLSAAMAKHPETFKPAVCGLVKAGEAAGVLDHVVVLIVECAWRFPGRVV
jgi:type II secretory pathway component PulF